MSVREKRNALFEAEKQRQLSLLARIEKIEVQYKGQPEDCTLVMNKNLSTPFKCAVRKWISLLLLAVSLDNLVGRGCPPSTDLFSSPEYAQFWVATSCCCCVG